MFYKGVDKDGIARLLVRRKRGLIFPQSIIYRPAT